MLEIGKKKPLVVDTVAADLVANIDYDFEKYKGKNGSFVGSTLRANYFDTITKEFIFNNENVIVVNVGCGLDSRLQRVGEEVSEKAIFYELDLPEVIVVRKELIPLVKNQHFIASSMFDTKWLDDLLQKHPNGNFIFVIEGVLMYFDEKDIKPLFIEIANRFPGAKIHFDTWSKYMSTKSDKHETIKKTKAKFQFGIDDASEIEALHPKLKHKKTVFFKDLKGAFRMGIICGFLMNIIPVFRKSFKFMSYKVEK